MMGPDFHTPDTGIHMPDHFLQESTDKKTALSEGKWWYVFNNPGINQTVNEALQNNLDIKKAAAGILEIQARFVQTRADRFPTLNLNGQAQRQRVQTGNNITRTNTYGLSLPASFEVDLWGKLARAEEASQADLLQAEDNFLTIVQAIVSETIDLFLQMESLERRIQITKESIKNYQDSVSLVESRYERGLSSMLDLKQASRTLAQAEVILPPLRQAHGITQQKLAVLLGKYPGTSAHRTQPEDYFKLLDPVPPGLPSELLLRRPDIRAAEAGLKALNARIGVAKANRFPSITLTGSLGYSSSELNTLLNPESELWNIAAGIVQPLFNAGKLKAAQQAAEAKYQHGLFEYAKIVLTAFSEVESTLLTEKEKLEQRKLVLDYLEEAKSVQKVAETRYGHGLTDYLTVLESQRTRFQAEKNLVQVELEILTNRVSLHRVLGSTWNGIKERGRNNLNK